MATFFDLPTELVLQVMSEVEPIDLLRFSQVCRLAHAMVSQRTIWEQVLQRLYRSNGLFEPSFQPMDSMDVDGLKKAALRPHRFQSQLLRLSTSADKTLYKSRDIALPKSFLGCFARVQFIPGGRFVVGLGIHFVYIWDIGPPGSQMTPLLLDVVRNEEPGKFYNISNPVQASDSSFRFALTSGDWGQTSSRRIRAYEVAPLETYQRVRLLGEFSLEEGPDIRQFWISRDRVFLNRNNNIFVVWDFVSSSAASWTLTFRNPQAFYDLFSVGNVIVAFEQFYHEIRAWKIPVLQPTHQCSVSPHAHFEELNVPISVIPLPDHWRGGSRVNLATLWLPSQWEHPSHTSPIVDIIYFQSRLTRIRIEVSPNEDKVEATLVSTSESSGFTGLYGGHGCVQLYTSLGSGLYLAGKTKSNSLSIHHSTFDPSSTGINHGGGEGEEHLVKWCTLKCSVDHVDDGIRCTSICPYSGRLAYACDHHPGDDKEALHVVDLLK